MSEHTPWEIEREELGLGFSIYEQPHVMPVEIGPIRIERIDGDDYQIELVMNLISAAPELLEACRAVIWEYTGHKQNLNKQEPSYIREIRKAIAKAEGKS